ncbi:MAG: hypothetical protein EHM28_05855 [Spirochaetaceae bacterium]|nr:MAG: hypothetical protein EHM28_05855 [Spirochaetaceae bacterium]
MANVGNRSVFSTFVSLISAIYLFASIFSTTPPAFIDAVKVSTLTLDVCRIYLPVAGLVFFLFQILVSFLNRKGPENSSLQNT